MTIRQIGEVEGRRARRVLLHSELDGLRRKVEQLERENRQLRSELNEARGSATPRDVDNAEESANGSKGSAAGERCIANGTAVHRIQKKFELYQENKELEVKELEQELKSLKSASSTREDGIKSRLQTPAVGQRRPSGCSSPVPFPLPFAPLTSEVPDGPKLDIPPHIFLPQNRRYAENTTRCMHMIYIVLGKDMEGHLDWFREEYEEELRLKTQPEEIIYQVVSSLELLDSKWRRKAVSKATSAIALVGVNIDAELVEQIEQTGSKMAAIIATDNVPEGLKKVRVVTCSATSVGEILRDELSRILISESGDTSTELCVYRRYCNGHAASPYVSGRQTMLRSFYSRLGKGICFAKHTENLQSYIDSHGKTSPLVVSGGPGMGATCLLNRLVDSLQSSGRIVLYHFVISSRLSHPNCVVSSLAQQLSQYIPEVTVDTTPLFTNFAPSLRKIAHAHPRGIVIVIDSVDRVPHFDAHLAFLWCNPTEKIKIVISLHEDRCPETWLQFPHLQLEPPTYHSLQQVLANRLRWRRMQLERPLDTRFLMRCHSGARCCPLYVSVFVSALKYFSAMESVAEIFAKLVLCSDVATLYESVLCRLQACFPITERTLGLISASREGLAHFELLQLLCLDSWEELYPTIDALARNLLIADEDGFVWIPFADARKVVRKFCGKADRAKEEISAHFEAAFRTSGASVRVVDEMVHMAQDGGGIQLLLMHPVVFSLLYTRGRGCELRHLWYNLGDASELSSRYLKSFETELDGHQGEWGAVGASLMWGALGRFLQREVEAPEQDSLLAYHRALSTCERDAQPDHPAVALFLQFISEHHDQYGKPSLSRAFLNQSLQIYSHHLPPSHPVFRHGLESLSALYRTHGKMRLATMVSEKLNSLQETARVKEAVAGQAAILKKTQSTLGEMHPVALCAKLNLAILCSKQGRTAEAQELYESCVELCKKAYGDEHVLVAKVMRNFALFRKEQGDYTEATRLYLTSEDIFNKATVPLVRPAKPGSKSARSGIKARLKNPRLSAKSSPPIFH